MDNLAIRSFYLLLMIIVNTEAHFPIRQAKVLVDPHELHELCEPLRAGLGSTSQEAVGFLSITREAVLLSVVLLATFNPKNGS
jgi:hypothetical protein